MTKSEVELMEEQRELRDRAREAGSTIGMSWDERQRFREEQERRMWDRRYRETHGGLSKAEVQAAGPNGSGRQYAAIKRGFELQEARAHEMQRLGKELATREQESRDRKEGMIGQGREAAEANRDAVRRKAELETASAERIAGINKDRDVEIAGIKTKSNEAINKDKNDVAYKIADIQGETAEKTARINAEEGAAQRMAETLMREWKMTEEERKATMERMRAEANEIMKKSVKNGRPTISPEQAMQRAKMNLERWGTMPGSKLEQWRQ